MKRELRMLKGQLTYNHKKRTWGYTPQHSLTSAISQAAFKIQSRSDYYIAWTSGSKNEIITNHSIDLEGLVKWVENGFKKNLN